MTLTIPDRDQHWILLLEQLYESITQQPAWQSFLDMVNRMFEADLGTMVIESRTLGFPDRMNFTSSGHDEEYLRAVAALYEAEQYGDDTAGDIRHRTSLAVLASQNDASGRPRLDQSLSVIIAVDNRTRLHFGLWRYEGRQPFQEQERQGCRFLVPSLERAISIFMRCAKTLRERAVYMTVVDQVGVGVALVDAQGVVMTTNAIGREILDAGDGLKIADGVLIARDPRLTRILHENIRASAEAQTLTQPEPGRPIAIERPASTLPLTAIVYPGPNASPALAPLRRTAVVVLRDPDRRAAVSSHVVAQLFGLTPAEATLAAQISQGATLDEAAQQLGVRRNTARSQLQSIFQKTGANRQSELVRMILSSVATLAT